MCEDSSQRRLPVRVRTQTVHEAKDGVAVLLQKKERRNHE